MTYPRVMTEDETLDAALAGRSLSRFGDGELRLAVGGACSSQRAVEGIAEELREILASPGPALVCIPRLEDSPRAEAWSAYANGKYAELYQLRKYGSAFITRPDNQPHIDRPEFWDKVQQLWRGRDVILVVGDEKSLTPTRMPGHRSVSIVRGPRQHAYAEIDKIQAEIERLWKVKKESGGDPIVLLCLGAAATVLAHRLAKSGAWAVDLGHIGMFMKHVGAWAIPERKLASRDYRKQLTQVHKTRKWGTNGWKHAGQVFVFWREIDATSILDYGCGLGTLAVAMDPIRVYDYDPGVEGKNSLPKPCSLVVCTDVLEHVEPGLLDNVLRHIYLLAGKGIYADVALFEDGQKLPDGRDLHLILRTPDWWIKKLAEAWPGTHRNEIHGKKHAQRLRVWVKK